MASPIVLLTGPIDPRAEEILRPFGRLVVAPDGREATLLPLMSDAIALVVRGGGVATGPMIAAAPSLRVIGRSGAGCDQVDVAAATARGVPVVYAPGFGGRAVAEASVLLMLALTKRLLHWDREMKRGNWQSRFESFPSDLAGRTVGIVGLGAIGSALAEMLRVFDVRTIAYDPGRTDDDARLLGVTLMDLDALLASSDIVALHAPLTPQTRSMINRASIARLKPGALLINLGRGALVESLDVLCEGLDNGQLSGVALDVFDPEPPDTGHPFFRRPEVIVAPHALGITDGSMRRIFESMALDMAAVLSGGEPRHVFNRDALAQTTRGLSAS